MATFRVVELVSEEGQKEHKGHSRPEVAPGTKIYAIKHMNSGLFFYYAYLASDAANSVCANLSDDTNIEANFRQKPGAVTDYGVKL